MDKHEKISPERVHLSCSRHLSIKDVLGLVWYKLTWKHFVPQIQAVNPMLKNINWDSAIAEVNIKKNWVRSCSSHYLGRFIFTLSHCIKASLPIGFSLCYIGGGTVYQFIRNLGTSHYDDCQKHLPLPDVLVYLYRILNVSIAKKNHITLTGSETRRYISCQHIGAMPPLVDPIECDSVYRHQYARKVSSWVWVRATSYHTWAYRAGKRAIRYMRGERQGLEKTPYMGT